MTDTPSARPISRRALLRSAGLAGAAATLLPRQALALPGTRTGAAAQSNGNGEDPPRTGFEERGGASWTTAEEEYEFLDALADRSPRIAVDVIGETAEGRPLHLIRLGDPAPPTVGHAEHKPVLLHLGCQHGNEPAGREAVLQYARDLAFTDDPVLVAQMQEQVFLINPTTNPNGRSRNQRTNGTMDINRDHLGLTQPETRAIHRVIRDWRPAVMLDHHEYGPSVPVVYDAEILYLWPRNLNADPQVRDLARTLAEHYIGKGAEQAGYTADEYGIYKVGEQSVLQTAGGPDEGISRNAAGLRHALGILIESAVYPSNRRPGEVVSDTDNRLRRVASQYQTVMDTLRFMREQGDLAKFASDGAPQRAARDGAAQSRPTYWGGADNEEPSSGDIDDPPACRYELTDAQMDSIGTALGLHGVFSQPTPAGDWQIPMGQGSRTVIPLLLDGRGSRNEVSGQAVYDCG